MDNSECNNENLGASSTMKTPEKLHVEAESRVEAGSHVPSQESVPSVAQVEEADSTLACSIDSMFIKRQLFVELHDIFAHCKKAGHEETGETAKEYSKKEVNLRRKSQNRQSAAKTYSSGHRETEQSDEDSSNEPCASTYVPRSSNKN